MSLSPEHENEPPEPRRRSRRWFQFGLSTLLAVTALAAGGTMAWRVYVEPYRRQRETMALIEKLGGSYETAAADKWLCWLFGGDFQNITLVDLAGSDESEAYLDDVAALPALATLVVGGEKVADGHLRRLRGLTTLRWLVLDSTDVTDQAIRDLRNGLEHLDVYRSERRAINRLENEGFVLKQVDDSHVPLPAALDGQYRTAASGIWLEYPDNRCRFGPYDPVPALQTPQDWGNNRADRCRSRSRGEHEATALCCDL